MNLRHALRALAADWRFSAFVFVILALAIGVNAAMYTLVDAILFRPLALPDEERLVRVFASEADGSDPGPQMSFPVYADYRDQSRSFARLAAFSAGWGADFSTGGEPIQIELTLATGNFFETLGARAARGRFFSAADDKPGHYVAVISDALWRSHFAAAENTVGRTVLINGTPFTVIGVAPRAFRGATIDTRDAIWVPVSTVDAALQGMGGIKTLTDRRTSWVSIVGRLRDGVTLEQAQAELRTIAARRAKQQVGLIDPSATLFSATMAAIDLDRRIDARRAALFVTLFVALILIIACVNAGGLQLVRGERRQRELAIRTAIGAPRRKLVAQLAAEALLLAVAASVAGIALAHALVRGLTAIAPDDFPLLLHVSLPVADTRVLAVTAGLTILSTLLFGLIPALRSSRVNVAGVMKGSQSMPHGAALQSLLVVVQITLCVVLLVFAGLLLRTLARMGRVEPGFPTKNAAVASLNARRQGYRGPKVIEFTENVRARLAQMPEVAGAGFGGSVPVTMEGMRTSVSVPGYTAKSSDPDNVALNPITPGYLHALGVPLVRGRDFDGQDTAESAPVVIINEAMARKYWPRGDALGKIIQMEPDATVVGIVATTKVNSVREEPTPIVYMPLAQFPTGNLRILVRARTSAEAAMRALVSAVRAVDADLPIVSPRSLEAHVGAAIAKERTFAILLGGFGALALLLTSAGLFGVVAYRTAGRRRELGIRIALGALRRDVAAIVVRQTAVLVSVGVAAGVVVASLLVKFAEALLFGVTAHDPVTFAAVPLLLLAVGVAATWGPVRQAVSLAPAETLRHE